MESWVRNIVVELEGPLERALQTGDLGSLEDHFARFSSQLARPFLTYSE